MRWMILALGTSPGYSCECPGPVGAGRRIARERAEGMEARYTLARKSDDEYHEALKLDPDGKGFKPSVSRRFLKVPS